MDHSDVEAAVFASRVTGCLLAGAVGDALGGPVEFSTLFGLRRQYGDAGITDLERTASITDDTQMTLFTVEGLIRHRVRIPGRSAGSVERAVSRALYRWRETQNHGSPADVAPGEHRDGWLLSREWLYRRRAPGQACLSGVERRLSHFAEWGRSGEINPESKGCGTVMRSAPFGLYAVDAPTAFELAARCAQYTHGHPTGYLAAGAFAALIHHVGRGVELTPAVSLTLDLLSGYPGGDETAEALRGALALAEQGSPTAEKVELLGGGWVAEEALAIAVYCASTATGAGAVRMRRALLSSVNHSGDSDSTGAMCGNLMGALLGAEAIPGDWLARLEHRDEIGALAADFVLSLRDGGVLSRGLAAWQSRYPGA
ncbi:ADP-ribosylglycohydrolase [Stackebrandtia albiflava]|uniref:ADP-ribosylglycohydrolase n=1 Tax=Stackebrandtia albiflava TaxID=406432 RepID=A0A562ULL4_9ACTN|nr:ADP-ribosylglycohydrolase family protein [Stackebrandtia albiflava]TWJ06521.1 ADP-ribosylglycohydrolase [Stackebrandtia albiflava]